jgi:hypothetical protein
MYHPCHNFVNVPHTIVAGRDGSNPLDHFLKVERRVKSATGSVNDKHQSHGNNFLLPRLCQLDHSEFILTLYQLVEVSRIQNPVSDHRGKIHGC